MRRVWRRASRRRQAHVARRVDDPRSATPRFGAREPDPASAVGGLGAVRAAPVGIGGSGQSRREAGTPGAPISSSSNPRRSWAGIVWPGALLALEEPGRESRSSGHRPRDPAAPHADCRGESDLGRAQDHGRACGAGTPGQRRDGRTLSWPPRSVALLANLPSAACVKDLGRRLSRRADVDLQTFYVFFLIGHDRRCVLHWNVTTHPKAPWSWRQMFTFLNAPLSGAQGPRLPSPPARPSPPCCAPAPTPPPPPRAARSSAPARRCAATRCRSSASRSARPV